MIDIKDLQKKVMENKTKKGFNTTDVKEEFCHLHEEVSEAFRAYFMKHETVGEELADVMIYLLSIADILEVDLEASLIKKIEKNERREYTFIDGVYVRTKEG